MKLEIIALFAAALVCGCLETDGDDGEEGVYLDAPSGAQPLDGGSPPPSDPDDPLDPEILKCSQMSNRCASTFGTLFTDSNGRADGTLLALLETTDSHCRGDNDDHVVLQVQILGEVQRLVVSVDDIAIHAVSAPLLGPPFSEGWHTNQSLDYAHHLDVHSGDFQPATMVEATRFMCRELEVGAPISVYAYSDGTRPDSAHQIHRNDRYPDGAVVARPDSDNPLYLLFRYEQQTF